MPAAEAAAPAPVPRRRRCTRRCGVPARLGPCPPQGACGPCRRRRTRALARGWPRRKCRPRRRAGPRPCRRLPGTHALETCRIDTGMLMEKQLTRCQRAAQPNTDTLPTARPAVCGKAGPCPFLAGGGGYAAMPAAACPAAAARGDAAPATVSTAAECPWAPAGAKAGALGPPADRQRGLGRTRRCRQRRARAARSGRRR